jgi:LmbE family N-acetylglucosaminyl deacetylase
MSPLATLPTTLLGVWAHPDDEAYLSAGLMARVVAAGGRVVCVTATLGEGGAGPLGAPRDRLAAVRQAELQASLALLGVSDLRLLGYADGHCAEVPPREPADHLATLMDTLRPDAVVTFGPDGITGHPDHVAVSDWVTQAWLDTGRGELLYATMSDDFLAEWDGLHREIGMYVGHAPEGTPDHEIALRVPLSGHELNRKIAALRAHTSQTSALEAHLGAERFRTWWST